MDSYHRLEDQASCRRWVRVVVHHPGELGRASNQPAYHEQQKQGHGTKFWRWPNLPLLSPLTRGALLSQQSQRRERSKARSRIHRHHTVHEGMCGIKIIKPRQSCPQKRKQLS
ncbi:hypothetical protein FJTKL_14527 [Diaporthe vaccinii]|uniref:Uncharacterized protein n=1 Tax=Diaporthe vaccinii TaxID=105482 RepID=A0ABR4E749_9PEZI